MGCADYKTKTASLSKDGFCVVLPAGLEISLDGACRLYLNKNRLSFERRLVVLPAGLEPATYCSASKRSNPLSYGSIV